MKKFLLGSVGLAAMLAGPAMAADMPVVAPPPPPVLYDWSGVYVGGNIGGVWYDVDRTFPNATGAGGFGPGSSISSSDSDGIFGFHAGAQWQWGAWVLGVEAALSGCFHECRSYTGVLPVPPFTANTFGEHKITNLYTAGARLGYAWDRLMIFASGGWAAANLKGTYCSTGLGICDSVFTVQDGASWNHGYYVGGGFDYMIHKGPLVDVIFGLEYQHFDVSDNNDRAFCAVPGCAAPAAADYDLSATGDLVRARLTIKTPGFAYFWR
jgi:outer membrane immunogenic protein